MPVVNGLSVTYSGGTAQQRILFEAAVNGATFDWTRFLFRGVTVQWADLAPDLNDPAEDFTTVTGTTGFSQTITIHNGLDTIEDPRYAGQVFYMEAVMNALGRAFYWAVIAINAFGNNRLELALTPGENLFTFAVGEFFKDIYSLPANRRYLNRSDWEIADWETLWRTFQDELHLDDAYFQTNRSATNAGTQQSVCLGDWLGNTPCNWPTDRTTVNGDGDLVTIFTYPCEHHFSYGHTYNVPSSNPLPTGHDWLDEITVQTWGGPVTTGPFKTFPCDSSEWADGFATAPLVQFGERVSGVTQTYTLRNQRLLGGGGLEMEETFQFTPGSIQRRVRATMGGIAIAHACMAPQAGGGFSPWPVTRDGGVLLDTDGQVIHMDVRLLAPSIGEPGWPYGREGSVAMIPSHPGITPSRNKQYRGLRDPFAAPDFV